MKEKENGIFAGLTFRQAATVISRATGNDVLVNPFDARSIERAALKFGDNNSGSYPHIEPLDGGGFCYTTISGRTLSVRPDGERWTLDCTQWWERSENFQGAVIGCLKEILVDESLRDESLPAPEPKHIHGGVELVEGIFYLEYTPVNNHGCRGFSVEVKATSPTEGIVVVGGSCSSCHQVGHDDSESPIPIGTAVRLPANFCWLCASESDPDFMAARDVSPNGRTMVEPDQLIKFVPLEAGR